MPPGVEWADARDICPNESLVGRYIADGRRSFAKFSNLFRCRMIRKTRLCWVDTDMLRLRRPDSLARPMVFGRQLEASHSWTINNAVLTSAMNSAPWNDLAGRPVKRSSRPSLLRLRREACTTDR